ncbi:MAG: glycogen synthase, partial [Desulfatiglandales bacterium]
KDPFFKQTATVFTIHNLGYQGTFPSEKLFVTGLPSSFFSPGGLEYWGKISLLKAGIVYADVVTTVSPRYSQEIQTPEFGFGLDGVLKERRQVLHGILNGVDYMTWDPSIDEHIAKRYGPETLEGKKKCKRALLDEMGMDSALMDRPVLGMVSRLVSQKGTDLLIKKSNDLSALGIGVIVLATGEQLYQDSFMEWAGKDPKRIGVRIGFDERLAHSIIAGSDILLIPSRYEPCGLTQMYALKYGTVPLVRATGGLEDSVEQFDLETGEGTGFKFKKYDPEAFLEAIRSAVDLFGDKLSWNKLIQNGMKADFSWDRSARQYLDLYNKILRR